ncbi:MAG TPA: ATP phosphoribosyltransferase regulatory subunit [Thermoanaerobaculia bacterium]|nr:ATP phosphoribosyltransferase regulatory subunit [Thermoanaerobaculia bacterium]
MATAFRYPTGARPLLIEETARRRMLEARVVALLEAANFAEIVLPVIDFAEPYAGIGHAASKRSYRFTDRDGELVAVRSDFTPMVARALAPSLNGNLPLRVFYRGDVIRCDASRLGKNRELFQIGAEIVGDPSRDADLEMLHLAAAIAAIFSESPLVVYSGGQHIDDPRFVEHDDTVSSSGSSRSLGFLGGVGSGRLLPSEEPRGTPRNSEERGYYTGVRFWVYGDERRAPLAQGGRYDTLYERFGKRAPAVGFTFTVN